MQDYKMENECSASAGKLSVLSLRLKVQMIGTMP
jgi:hypothetical protein